MDLRPRDIVAFVLALVCATLGAAALYVGRTDMGVEIGVVDGDHLVVTRVAPTSPWKGVAQTGMVVASINAVDLIGTRKQVYPDDGSTPAATPFSPVSEAELGSFVEASRRGEVIQMDLVTASDFEVIRNVGIPGGWSSTFGVNVYGPLLADTAGVWETGVLLLIAGFLFLGTGRAGATLQQLSIPLSTAMAAPLLLLPAHATFSPVAIASAGVLLPLALAPLAAGFIELTEDARLRRRLTWVCAALGVGTAAAGVVIAFTNPMPDLPAFTRGELAAALLFVPGFVAARPASLSIVSEGSPSNRLVERTEVLVAAITPLFALVSFVLLSTTALPLLLWIAVVLSANRFTVRPLARLATRAQLQRDLVVAAMEAERSRLAADLHDDALQDVTMLVRRLDAAGDEEGAAMARTIADRLRQITGDLRLPILDDLGVGPALDWLVTRIERLAGGEVRLEVADGPRAPADVELAVFRVAQEALANAVKHGRPPIIVRYRATASGVSLSVDDAGPGIDPDAPERAPAEGHYGLLGMTQRAEQVGAILDVRRWPGGGTHVALEWRPR